VPQLDEIREPDETPAWLDEIVVSEAHPDRDRERDGRHAQHHDERRPRGERQEMPVTFCGQFIDHREVERGAIGEIDQDLVLAVFEHVIESRAAPGLRRVALAG